MIEYCSRRYVSAFARLVVSRAAGGAVAAELGAADAMAVESGAVA